MLDLVATSLVSPVPLMGKWSPRSVSPALSIVELSSQPAALMLGELAGQRLLRAHEDAKEVGKLMLSAEKEFQDEMYDTWLLFGLPALLDL